MKTSSLLKSTKSGRTYLGLLGILLLTSSVSWAIDQVPDCPAYGRSLPINNSEVLHWKRTTSNTFRERAHVQGSIVEVYPNRNGHVHFVINIGKYDDDTIEVIYNEDFGEMKETPAVGMQVEACGDYITSVAQNGPYPPSPAGAIIHWVHLNPKYRGHDPGFLEMDGTLYGQDAEHAGPGRHGQVDD